MWDETKVKITPVAEMEGLQFAMHYFDDNTELFVSPSIFEQLKEGTYPNLKFVMLSVSRKDDDIENIATMIVNKFKSLPPGKTFAFDVEEKVKEFQEKLTGKQRVIVSPLFTG